MNLLHLVLRQWRQRPARTLLSILSVAIAIAAALGTALAQSSVRKGVVALQNEIGGAPTLEIVSVAGGRFAPADVPPLTDVPGVTHVFPVVSRPTMGRVHGKRFRGVLLGLPVEQKAAWSALPLTDGRICEGPDEAILAAETAESLGAVPGDRLIVIARRGPRTATIVGLARSAALGEFASGATLAMPMSTVQKLFGLDGSVDRLRLFVDKDVQRLDVLTAVSARLPNTLVVQAPAGQIEQIDSTLRPLELALRFAGALSIAMAVFLILNTLRMNFSERRRDMAIVRVLGATTTQILGLHLAEGVCIGLVGAAAGIPLSLMLARGLEHALGLMLNVSIPAHDVSLVAVGTAVVLGPVVATIAALLPALQSRRISAIEALSDSELRPAERIPVWAVFTGVAAWCIAVSVLYLVVTKRLPPAAAIPAGLLMLIGFVAIIPAMLVPLMRVCVWLLTPCLHIEGSMAAKQLLQRSTRAGLTAGVLVVAMSNGLGLGSAIINNVDDIREWYRHALRGDAFLFDPSASDRIASGTPRDALRTAIAEAPTVESVTEERYLPTRVNGMPGICVLRNYPPQAPLPWALGATEEARLRAGLKNGEVAVSSVLARKLNLGVGDTLRLELRGRIISGRIASLVREYVLGGMIVSLDVDIVATQIEIGAADAYVVRAAPGTSPAELARNLEAVVTAEGLTFTSVAEMRAGLDRMVNTVVAPLWAVMALGFVVGGAAVANTLTMSVLEQTRELGLLRVVGMTRAGIRKMVVWESLLLGTFGAFMGMLAGLVTAYTIHICNEPLLGYHVPMEFHSWLIAANILGCLLIATVAALSPAERAAKLNLLSAIAYE